ncbi:hypothetical protein AVEN_247971-1 [Araneus ventricosus]|uniref:Uncharacterized protein n=1 Tax=Araneus ventricosus TaxID=182803 RepID=A0A4Y2CJJ5_ARAVE|nr:hypothetical protein AVEN_247971-1 [Araneus ventricosus]
MEEKKSVNEERRSKIHKKSRRYTNQSCSGNRLRKHQNSLTAQQLSDVSEDDANIPPIVVWRWRELHPMQSFGARPTVFPFFPPSHPRMVFTLLIYLSSLVSRSQLFGYDFSFMFPDGNSSAMLPEIAREEKRYVDNFLKYNSDN